MRLKTDAALKRWSIRTIKPLQLIVPALVALSIFGVFSGSNEQVIAALKGSAFEDLAVRLHTGNSILFNLSNGVLGGILVWFLVAWIPEKRRRSVIRANLATHYKQFKEDTIQILLFASIGTHDSELPKRLCDHQEFQSYFKANGDEQWYAALNGLQDSSDYLNDILVELELLASEVSYALSSVNVADDEVHAFFKRLSEQIYRLKRSSIFTHDQVKYLGNFLWGILARWSFIDGQRQNDIVQDMIDRM